MALSTSTYWEVRGSTGSNTNGGGFVAGASGTDWSQQAAAQYSVTDGVTAGTATITSATANFGTDVVGNIIYVQGGTGSISAGWYQIISRTNATTIVVDRSNGLTAGTGVTLNIGGAFATIQKALDIFVSNNRIYVQDDAIYSISATLTEPSSVGSFTGRLRCIGYTTTRGDLGRPTVRTSGAINCWSMRSDGFQLENFILDGNSVGLIGLTEGATYETYASNVKCMNFTSHGFSGQMHLVGCEAASNGGSGFNCTFSNLG